MWLGLSMINSVYLRFILIWLLCSKTMAFKISIPIDYKIPARIFSIVRDIKNKFHDTDDKESYV